jgi:hypothetical protein
MTAPRTDDPDAARLRDRCKITTVMRGRVFLFCAVLILLPLRLPADCGFAPIYSGQFRATVFDIAVDGNDLWAATGYGVALYDASANPPILRRSTSIAGRTTTIRATGGYAIAGSGSTLYRITKEPTRIAATAVADVAGTINDLLLGGSYLFVAASNGLTVVSLVDPLHPSIVQRPSAGQTSTGAAVSLAVIGNFLYLIDGDSSVEVFSIASSGTATHIGSFSTFPRPLAVTAQGARLFISDGFQTQIFTGSGAQMMPAGAPFGTAVTELAPISATAAITAGPDLRLRALDLAGPVPVNLFAADLPAGVGTSNRVFRILTTTDRAFVAAGDAGLRSFDIGGLKPPYAIRSFPFSGLTSLRLVTTNGTTTAVVSGPTGLQELSVSASGVSSLRQWTSTNVEVVRDAVPGLLLTSTDTDMTLWTTAPPTATPSVAGRVSLNGVRSAVVLGTNAYAVTSDHALWTAPMTQPGARAIRVATTSASPSFIARAGNAIALADINSDGTTTIRYFDNGDFSATPQTATFEGAATSGIALSAKHVAALTFRGLNVVDFTAAGAPTTKILSGSSGAFGTQLALAGSTLFLLTTTGVQVFDTDSGALTRTLALPLDPVAIAVDEGGTTAAALTSDSFTAINWKSPSQQPVATGIPSQNNFYSKVTVSADRLGLLDRGSLDSWSFLDRGGLPVDFQALRTVQGIVDAAALPRGFAVLGGSGKLSLLSASGSVLSELVVDNARDALPLTVNNVGGAIWVSVSKSCVPGPCQKVTTVFDSRSGALTPAATLSGGVIDVVVSGSKAYALFDLPGEIRALDISDPFHPAIIAARSTVGLSTTPPASIAFSQPQTTVYVLADKLNAFSEQGLLPIGQVPVPAATSSFGQSVRIDGSCALVAGRTDAPQLYSVEGPLVWRESLTPSIPSPIRSIATRAGYFYVLTERSLEVWSSVAQEPKVKRHAAH